MKSRQVNYFRDVRSGHDARKLVKILFYVGLSFGCSQDDSRNVAAPVPTSTISGAGGEEVGTGVADSLSFGSLSTTTLFTKVTAANTCVSFSVSATMSGAGVEDVGINLEIKGTGELAKDSGSLNPSSGRTDASGNFSAVYCSGDAEGQAVIVAKSGAISSNSAKITVTKKPTFEFTYLRSDADPEMKSSEGEGSSKDVIFLNLLDSGPQDCTHLYFKLTQSGSPLVGQTLSFKTQVDFPKGAKLGKRSDTLQTQVDSATGKKYSVFTAISSGAGEFQVPICAGVALGTIQVSSVYTDVDNVAHRAQSPVLRVTAGLTNYINMSLTFDNMNARTMKAYFNTNSSYQLPLTVQLGARFDGDALVQYPVSIAAEVGRVIVENGGTPSKDTGAVSVKLQSLHLVNQYPFPVQRYDSYPLAQTRCEPNSLAAWGAGQGQASVLYSDLRRNWRSTMVYSIRGQEHYNDANRNGVYDVGGDGFWDKNQNGVYDSGDALTYDAGGDGLFNPSGEWFIDLPSPFVDVDEDGIFSANSDILMGDEYQAPSAKREADAMLWKYEYFPISMGASPYGLQRYRINTAAYNSADTTLALTGAGTYEVFGLSSINAGDLWGGAVTAAEGHYSSVIFAHDLCGNLLPGGSEISMNFITSTEPAWGARIPFAYYHAQPGDIYLEPARQLIKEGDNGSKAIINFNAIDHPAAAQSYPILGAIEIPACTNTCTGAVVRSNPGVSCDGWSGLARLSVKEPQLDTSGATSFTSIDTNLSFGSYQMCNCVANTTESAGVCTCTGTLVFDSAAGACL